MNSLDKHLNLDVNILRSQAKNLHKLKSESNSEAAKYEKVNGSLFLDDPTSPPQSATEFLDQHAEELLSLLACESLCLLPRHPDLGKAGAWAASTCTDDVGARANQPPLIYGQVVPAPTVVQLADKLKAQFPGSEEMVYTDNLQNFIHEERLLRIDVPKEEPFVIAGLCVLSCPLYTIMLLRREYLEKVCVNISPRSIGTDVEQRINTHYKVTNRSPHHLEYVRNRQGYSKAWERKTLEWVRKFHERMLLLFYNKMMYEEQSQRKQLEKAKDEAMKAADHKANFLAYMSHELRTPFNGMIGVLAFLLDTPLNETQQEYTKTAYNCAENMLEILDDILLISKLESEKLRLREVAFNVDQLLKGVHELMSLRARQLNIHLKLSSDKTNLVVVGDPGRLRQILLNLIGNALKSTCSHGLITISHTSYSNVNALIDGIQRKQELYENCSESTKNITSTLLQFDKEQGSRKGGSFSNWQLFTIEDDGKGMTKKNLTLLFKAFAQFDSSKYEGTGLGLAICKQLVNLMHGVIFALSTHQKGSAFCFAVPLELAASNVKELDGMVSMETSTFDRLHQKECPSLKPCSFPKEKGESRVANQCRFCSKSRRDGYASSETTKSGSSSSGDSKESFVSYTKLKEDKKPEGVSEQKSAVGSRMAATKQPQLLLEKKRKCPSSTTFKAAHRPSEIETHKRSKITAVSENSTMRRHLKKDLVLVVEDNLVNQKLMQAMVTRMGVYDVLLASNGQEAVPLALENHSRLCCILMDCHMPVMNGIEASKLLRQLERQGDLEPVTIIALTADVWDSTREKCKNAGMDFFVTKPVNRKDLTILLTTINEELQPADLPSGSITYHKENDELRLIKEVLVDTEVLLSKQQENTKRLEDLVASVKNRQSGQLIDFDVDIQRVDRHIQLQSVLQKFYVSTETSEEVTDDTAFGIQRLEEELKGFKSKEEGKSSKK